MKNLYNHYKAILDWNQKCNVRDEIAFSAEWWRSIELQTNLLVEESEEAKDSAIFGDKVELLDGVVDTFVILSKLMDMLEKAGYDVEGAIEAIQANNDKKVYSSFYEAVEAKEKLEERDDVEYLIDTGIFNGLPFYSVKKMTGKVAKAVDFVPVNLEDYVP
jgi:hypothetical protein